ncbi:MAG: MFS transporter [Candidatus Binatia bacterium]
MDVLPERGCYDENIQGELLVKKHLAILFACLVVVMTGFGLTLPVLPFYIERLALTGGATSTGASVHVGVLTGIFALMQFFFAPLWGKWSDRVGRRPLFLIGLGGYAISMVLFGVGTNLAMFYTARILGGILSSAVLPAAYAYVADVSSENERVRGMAWLGGAISFGIVIGPALGALLTQQDWNWVVRLSPFVVDDFSMPFFAASLLAIVTLLVAMRWLPESLLPSSAQPPERIEQMHGAFKSKSPCWFKRDSFGGLLALSFLAQFALALFEGTFALHAQRVMNFGPAQMGGVFMVCGLVMAAAQASFVGWLISRTGEKPLLPIGFGLMGVALVLLMTTQTMALILVYVGFFALGVAMLNPSLAALVTKRAADRWGAALGLQNAANSLGQASGPVLGGLLFAWHIHAPYLLAALPLIGTAIFIGRVTLLKQS